MFTVKPANYDSYVAALELIANYRVDYSVIYKHVFSRNHITVFDTSNPEDLRLCEMAFQMNFRQSGKVCDACANKGLEFCGHLTFTSVI